MSGAVNIEQLLRELGFDTLEASARARAVLEAAALTNPRKQAIAGYKVTAAEALLSTALIRVCAGACSRRRGAGRERVTVSPASCELCRGSNNQRAALEATAALAKHGVRKVLIVGGADSQIDDVERLLARDGVELRIVDGTKKSHTKKMAIANMGWADLLVIWAPTPLRHSVSNLYSGEQPDHLRVISVPRRGIEALCKEIVESYRRSGQK